MESVQSHYVIKVHHADILRRLTVMEQPGGDSGLSFSELEGKIREMFQFPESTKLKITYEDKEKDSVTLENDDDLKDACIYQGLNPLRLVVVLVSPEGKSSGQSGNAPDFTAPFAGLEELSKEFLKNLGPENVMSMLHAYEPIFREMRHPSQIPDLMENVLKIVAAQFESLSRGTGAGNPGASNSEAPTSNKDQTAPKEATPRAGAQGPDCESVHYGVVCDGCGTSPIVGVRYKSIRKEDYDLCSSCHAKTDAPAGEYTIVNDPRFRGRHCHRGRMMGPRPWGIGGPMSRHPHCGMRVPQDCHGGRLDARFVRDVSIFDGTQLAPGTRFTKIWRLRNSGAIAWPANTRLMNVDGDDFGSATITPLEIGEQGLSPEEEIDVSVDCVAPQKTGRYQSTWRLAAPWGPKFGHKIWVQIQVVPSDTLDQPAQVDADGAHMEVGESSAAGGTVQPDQIGQTSTPVPAEVENGATEAENVASSIETEKGVAKLQETLNTEHVLLTTKEPETRNDVGFVSTKNMEESFVKVDVSNDGNHTPVIRMTETPTSFSEEMPEFQKPMNAEKAVVQETGHSDEGLNVPVESVTTEVPAGKSAQSAENGTDGNEDAAYSHLLVKLEAMGFTDRALNVELLKANALDLRKTVDSLCEAEDWAPALTELTEMGFNDSDMNRRLMIKYGGNMKRVVKELVQLAKYNA
ncbi:hypothetical protein R1sor_008681 [Riccia sorocarpa]|uniref:Uncharacterized protein n=1 Tax=Riccia sorocarpa TaxID=122646 RepID=A0ABD3HY46_9MARC